MAPKRKFSRSEEDQLIEFVKSHPLLYDRHHPEYRNIESRDKAWKQCAKKMNINTKICIQRWYNMRDYYRSKKKSSSTEYIRDREVKLSFLDDDQPTRDIEMVMTHTDDQSEAPHKTEIDSLHSQDGYSGDDASNSPPDFGTVSANQPIENEFVIIDGAEFEMRDDSHAPKAKRLKSIVPVTPFVTARTPHGHSLDIFFRAMCATVKTFPSADMAEIKLQISQIVGKKEIEIMNRPQT